MPRRKCYGEHVNDHQLELAGVLADDPRVRVVHDAEELWSAIQSAPTGRAACRRIPPLLCVLQNWMESFVAQRASAQNSRKAVARIR